jgi:hypothetical protein
MIQNNVDTRLCCKLIFSKNILNGSKADFGGKPKANSSFYLNPEDGGSICSQIARIKL